MSTFRNSHELCDMISTIIFCSNDLTMLVLHEVNSGELWVPSIRAPSNASWTKQIYKDILQEIFGCNLQINRILRHNKLWVPQHRVPYINHTVFEVPVTTEFKRKIRAVPGKYRGKIKWISQDDLQKSLHSNILKGPEIVEFYFMAKNDTGTLQAFPNTPPEYATNANFLEITEAVLVTGRNTVFEQLVEASGIDKHGQETLYKDFLLACYPSNYMNLYAFSKFLTELGWENEEAPNLFRSADFNSRNGISFRELLFFLAAVEPGTVHGGPPAELRCRYIFRYLDRGRTNALRKEEMRTFVILVRRSRKQPLDPGKIEKELSECYENMGLPQTHALSMAEFLKAVGELKVRGTSQILRAPHSIQTYIKMSWERDQRARALVASVTYSVTKDGASIPSRTNSSVFNRGNDYTLAIHTIKMERTGGIMNIEQLWNLNNALSASSASPALFNESNRQRSLDHFNLKSKPHELLKQVRYLSQVNKLQCYTKQETKTFNWGQLDPSAVAQNLLVVCQHARELFLKEPRLLELTSPIYVMGDLHGNFGDLLTFERVLWQVGPNLCPGNLLFLGDYVDRGVYSMEVISYLFCCKLLCPLKLKMLRGNHEIKRVQLQWTFEKELRLKFGEIQGIKVFDAINEVFDVLPLAAIVDGKVFCCHGGIPPPWLCPMVSAINDIPKILSDPQDQSSLAWELMWNDPVRSKNLTDKLVLELLANEGFAVNVRRGTAHVFSVEALEKFLATNGFTHLVRAHEVVEPGFTVQQKGKLLTVFSSSKYCGGQNEAACIMADQGKLRVLRLQTE